MKKPKPSPSKRDEVTTNATADCACCGTYNSVYYIPVAGNDVVGACFLCETIYRWNVI